MRAGVDAEVSEVAAGEPNGGDESGRAQTQRGGAGHRTRNGGPATNWSLELVPSDENEKL